MNIPPKDAAGPKRASSPTPTQSASNKRARGATDTSSTDTGSRSTPPIDRISEEIRQNIISDVARGATKATARSATTAMGQVNRDWRQSTADNRDAAAVQDQITTRLVSAFMAQSTFLVPEELSHRLEQSRSLVYKAPSETMPLDLFRLVAVLHCMKQPEHICIENLNGPQVGHLLLALPATFFETLRSLDLSKCNIDGASMRLLHTRFTQAAARLGEQARPAHLPLTQIKLRGLEGEMDLAREHLGFLPNCTKLRELSLEKMGLQDQDVDLLAPLRLKALNLSDNSITDLGLSRLLASQGGHLQKLEIRGSHLGASDVRGPDFAHAPQLQWLDIENNHAIHCGWLDRANLRACRSLHTLSMAGTQTGNDIAHFSFAPFSKLETLGVPKLQIQGSPTQSVDDVAQRLQSLVGLRMLYLEDEPIASAEHLAPLFGSLPQLLIFASKRTAEWTADQFDALIETNEHFPNNLIFHHDDEHIDPQFVMDMEESCRDEGIHLSFVPDKKWSFRAIEDFCAPAQTT